MVENTGTRHEKQQSQKLPDRRHSLLQRTISITPRQATSHTTSNDIIRIQAQHTTATDSSTTTDDNRSHGHGNSTRARTSHHHRYRFRFNVRSTPQMQTTATASNVGPIPAPAHQRSERLRHPARSPPRVRPWRRHEKVLRSVRQSRNTRRRHPQRTTFDDHPRF